MPAAPEYLAVGILRRPHGVSGEIMLEVVTDFPERLRPGVTLYVGEDVYRPIKLQRRRTANQALIVSFAEYSTPEEVGELRNQWVFVRAADRPPLPEGEYYHHQLIGLRVVTEEGRSLGWVKQILDTGANEVYIVQPARGPEILLPAIAEVILKVDLAAGEMRIHLLPGLLPDEG
jgi:16S rRNA processing protein RimM